MENVDSSEATGSEIRQPPRRFLGILTSIGPGIVVIVIAACLFISTAMQLFGSSS